MSQKIAKSPITILQEFVQKNKHPAPKYELIPERTETNHFHYRVQISDISTIGSGRSKQMAKHDASKKALKILASRGVYESTTNFPEDFDQSHQENFIGILEEMCKRRRLPVPRWKESFVREEQVLQFISVCEVGTMTAQSTAKSKKQAKQMAAKNMLDKVKDVEFLEESAKPAPLKEKIDQTMMVYSETLNLTEESSEKEFANEDYFINSVKKIMDEKGIKFEDFDEHFKNRTKEGLDEIFNKLDIKYEMGLYPKEPWISYVTFKLNIPFTLRAFGSTQENAKITLLFNIYRVLDIVNISW